VQLGIGTLWMWCGWVCTFWCIGFDICHAIKKGRSCGLFNSVNTELDWGQWNTGRSDPTHLPRQQNAEK